MTGGHHDHGTSLLATLLGLAASQALAGDQGVWKRIGIGVVTTVLGWLATRALSALERWWKGRGKS